MSSLEDLLTQNPATRDAVVADFASLIERKVNEQSGITGTILKGALGAAQKVDSGIVAKAFNRMLPDLARELDPHWQAFQQPGAGSSFGTYLEEHSDEVVQSVLSVADGHAEKISAGPIKKVYPTVRSKGAKLLESSLFDAGAIVHKHAA